MPCLLLIIILLFTWGERKIRSNIKKSQNIMTMILFKGRSKHWNFYALIKTDLISLKTKVDHLDVAFLVTQVIY